MQNSRAGINREVPARFQTLNLDRGESARVCDSSRPGGTGLGPRVPCVLEEEEGVTLLAPEVKLRGLVPDQQLAQINKGLSEPLWAPESCGQGSALEQKSEPKNCALISAGLRFLLSGGAGAGTSRPGHGSGSALALTQPPGRGGGVWQLHLLLAGCQSPVTSAAGMSFSPCPLRKDTVAGQVFVPSVLLSLQAREPAGTAAAGILPWRDRSPPGAVPWSLRRCQQMAVPE